MKKIFAFIPIFVVVLFISTSCNKNKDTSPPVITMIGDTTIWHPLGQPYNDPGATALDEVDGDITDKIVTTSNVDVNVQAYNYWVRYNVEDEAGNKAEQVQRTVNVLELK